MKKTAVLLILFQNIVLTAQTLHLNETLSLNGVWEIIYDDHDIGIQKKWFLNSNFKTHDSIQTINVPSCWEEFNKDYEGAAFYKTTFNVPQSWKNRIIELNFEASNYKTEVWLNDEVVGFHEGGYTPFKLRIDKLVKLGAKNHLIVRVVSPIILTDKRIDGIGRQEVPMWRGAIVGGIWQDVSISSKGYLTIEDVFLQTNINKKSVSYIINIKNSLAFQEESELEISLKDINNKTIHKNTIPIHIEPGLKTINYDIKVDTMTLWDLDNPYLYTAEVSLTKKNMISDKWTHKFGFREFTVKDDTFYLNNKPIYLKAAFFEGLYPTKLAYPDSKAMAIEEIKLAKEAGFNMIRPWRKPASNMWLDLCDEMGILTVGSLAVECMKRPISTPRLAYFVENELRKTIRNNRNRTSIVQWELFNEINRPILTQMLHEMAMLARELDPTRMILDESGGWGEGANLYLPYQKKQYKFNDVHHYSGSQITKEEFNGYLVTGKTKSQKMKENLEYSKGFGRNIVPGKMTYISELGYGSTPNLKENIIQFQTKGNPLLAPSLYHETLDKNYKKALIKTGFDQVFNSTSALYEAQQHIHGLANKRMIEATRLNDLVKGYCIHALTGGDWVLGAGLLDLWRKPKKAVYNATKLANAKQILTIQLSSRNTYSKQGLDIKVSAVNELEKERGNLILSLEDKNNTKILDQKFDVNLLPGISTLLKKHIDTDSLDGEYVIKIRYENKRTDNIINNTQSIFIKNSSESKKKHTPIAIVDPNNSLTNFLEVHNIPFTKLSKNTKPSTPVLVGSFKSRNEYEKHLVDVLRFIEKGGKGIILDVKGKTVKGFNRTLSSVSHQDIPYNIELQGKWATLGGWAAKSHIVTDHPIFKNLPVNQIAHGIYENVHPKKSMSKIEGNYIAGMIGYDHFPNNNIMLRHYNGPGDVWWAADILEVQIKKGKLVLSTYDIIQHLDKDPVADIILTNMINYLKP